MPEFVKPRPVWISPAVIGQWPRQILATERMDDSQTVGTDPLNTENPFLSATDNPVTFETGESDAEERSSMTEPVVEESNISAVQMLASTVPLPDSDPNELEALDSAETKAQEATISLEIDTGELTSPSKEWYSPTYSDEGMAARVWVSPQIAEYERWMSVKANLKIMELIPRSPYVPRTFAEWLTLRADMSDIKVRYEIRRRASPKLTASSRCRLGICANS